MLLDVHDLLMFNVQWSFFTYGQTKDLVLSYNQPVE